MPTLRHWDLAIDADRVLWGQGTDPALVRARRPRLAEIAAAVIEEGRSMLEPAVLYESYDVIGLHHGHLNLVGGGYLSGPLITQYLDRSSLVIVAACTIGDRLSRHASETGRTDPIRSMALDGLASAAAQELAVAACQHFKAMADAAKLIASAPLNPGMSGWPLPAGQAQIASLISLHRIGVEIDTNGLMTPVKSLSFVVGFSKKTDLFSWRCDYCTMRDTCRFVEHHPTRSI